MFLYNLVNNTDGIIMNRYLNFPKKNRYNKEAGRLYAELSRM